MQKLGEKELDNKIAHTCACASTPPPHVSSLRKCLCNSFKKRLLEQTKEKKKEKKKAKPKNTRQHTLF